jgi:hypothetical protein
MDFSTCFFGSFFTRSFVRACCHGMQLSSCYFKLLLILLKDQVMKMIIISFVHQLSQLVDFVQFVSGNYHSWI